MGRPIQLKPRLLALAERVPPGSRVADIGTDHARIPIYLLQHELTEEVYATDLRSGPLTMAVVSLMKHGVIDRVTLRIGDGAACLFPDEIDCAIIAGMGGDVIAHILSASPWLMDKILLLQPQTRTQRVLDMLAAHDKNGTLHQVTEGRRIYEYITVNLPVEDEA